MVADKIARSPVAARRGAALLGTALLGVLLAPALAAQRGPVTGTVRVLERDGDIARDVGQAVVWLDAVGAAEAAPARVDIATEGKGFVPRIVVVPVGSTLSFANHDPFNHNVFSPSETAPFDLGLYGRGETRSVKVARPGVVRVFCNVHAKMSAFVVVRDNPYFAQPSADGTFTIANVPPGDYTLHAWHERAADFMVPITIRAGGVSTPPVELDARGYRFVQHLDKDGQSYARRGRRY